MDGHGKALPGGGDPRLRELGWERWREEGAGEPPTEGRTLLDAVFGHSPFLTGIAAAEPEVVRAFVGDGPGAALDAAVSALPGEEETARADAGEAARLLRLARRRAALAVALADISGSWPVERVLEAWSDFACRLLELGAVHVLGTDAARSGYAVIALGKLGAGELNYSSDIDLAVFYDPGAEAYPAEARDGDANRHFTRVTHRLVKLFEERTAEGYLFRTDLRLRPDPGSTPAAVPVDFAENYYASFAQNWERAVLIRARAVAGDVDAGRRFLERISPFVWRRHLDFAAVRDVQAMQRQVLRGDGGFRAAGYNLKLGSGGIRDIEFFLQTRQLIWGGRDRELRVRGTAEGLRALAARGRLGEDEAERLAGHYRYLRRAENRLQMTRDEQTHEVPADDERRAGLASFLGYPDLAAFEEDLRAHVEDVRAIVAAEAGTAETLALPDTGSLVFTGVDPDPDTVATLARLGFADPEGTISRIADWHRGRIPATRSERGRELLTEITPALVDALGKTSDPDAAHAGFARFIEGLRAGVEVFSLFRSRPALLRVVAQVMGTAPLLGEALTARPRLLDRLIDQPLDRPLPDPEGIEAALDTELALGRGDLQDDLDAYRRWAGELRFVLGLRLIEGLSGIDEAGRVLTAAADVALRRLGERTARAFAETHGRIPDASTAFLALGKLGGGALLPGSDLDVVFLYDAPGGDPSSDGERPLPAPLYFERLVPRLVTAFTARTGEGMLWELDLRLRPHGNAGPLATPLGAYERYLAEEAWPVELLALARSRVVDGGSALAARVDAVVDGALVRERPGEDLAAALLELRKKIADAHGADDPFAVKHAAGGLLDLELLTQYLAVRASRDSGKAVRGPTAGTLAELARLGVLETSESEGLAEAERLYRTVQGTLRLTLDVRYDPDRAPAALTDLLGRVTGFGDGNALRAKLGECGAMVREAFGRHVGAPLPRGKGAREK